MRGPRRLVTGSPTGPCARLLAGLLAGSLGCLLGASAPTGDTAVAMEPASAAYVPIGPFRLTDTRRPDCGCTRPAGDVVRVDVIGHPAVPDTAVAAAITITALPTAGPAFVTAYPGGTPRPPTSTVNTVPGRAAANSAIVPLGADGSLDVFTRLPGDVVVDVTGAFVPATAAREGRFVAAGPQRLVDTRTGGAPLAAGAELIVPLPDGVAADASALALNVTSVGEQQPGHLSGRPAGTPPSTPTSFVNLDGSGDPVGAAAILPASPSGVTLSSHGGGHVVVDLVGWFTGESAELSGSGLFVPEAPHRLIDTRTAGPRVFAGGTREIPVTDGAAALVTNVTVAAADWRGYVTAYPAGTPRPETSTVNPSRHDHTVANLAITQAGTRGLAYYSLGGADLIVDASGYFTGERVDSAQATPPNDDIAPRVLIVGDSAMAGLRVFTDAQRALTGAMFHLDAENCRRLVHRSCQSDVTERVPNTALDAIQAAPGPFDIVYVDVGHNDWYDDDFAWQFHVIVQAARAQGAKVVLWSTYNEHDRGERQRAAYAWNNAQLRHLTALPQYADVLLADWSTYSSGHPEWFWDGTHVYRPGAWGLADYVARWVAAVTHRACPAPWAPGGPTDSPCAIPDGVGPPPDVIGLYR